ncbi:MAG: hypothetical protein QM808_15215 [Steroidobacteraceae bacterium]
MKISTQEAAMLNWFEEYYKHFALNFGQALQGIRYFHSHPDIDLIAPRGSLQHLTRSMLLRSGRVLNDLFFAVIPPHWHHTSQELSAMRSITFRRWFQYGFCAWRFTENGEIRTDLAKVDKRWDPRCKDQTS